MARQSPPGSPETRPAAVAGQFYPDDPGELERVIGGYLAAQPDVPALDVKGFVLPHAGYVFSGPVAATGYRALQRQRGIVQRVILLGPSHRIAFRGMAYPRHAAFATPLGVVPLDREAIAAIADLPQVIELDQAHAHEHSLEVHLPFLQVVLGEFRLVPLVVGDAAESDVAEVLDRLWGGRETCIIVSSDLSHYHPYATASAVDRRTAERIQALEPVTSEQACGAVPLDGLLRAARHRALGVRLLDLRNSGDTAGPRDRVVGYGAFAVSQPTGSDN